MADRKNPFEGFEVISVYSRAQAIADGVLHDVTDTAKDRSEEEPEKRRPTQYRHRQTMKMHMR